MASAQRGWISAMDQAAAGLLAQRGAAVSAVLAVVLLVIAIGVFMPGRAARGCPGAGCRRGRADLGGRGELRRRFHWLGHGPELGTAAGIARRRLLATRRRPSAGG
jgi:hypothetical protein